MVIGGSGDVVVETGGGHDRVEVGVDPLTRERVLVVNGVEARYPPGDRIVVRTGDGDDEVLVAPGTPIRVTILGGPGADVLRGGDGDDILHGEAGNDRLHGGAGNDQVHGGRGRDYIDGGRGDDALTGGRGNDTIYGLGGNDRISGGAGNDYLEGGRGDDTIDGGRGNDAISGGPGNDTVRGGPAHDHIYTGSGRDTVDGGVGDDTAYAQPHDTIEGVEMVVTVELRAVGCFIKIEGSVEFVERVSADLDMLRSSPRGQAMLAALSERSRATRSPLADVPVIGDLVSQGYTLTIREYVSLSRDEDNSFAYADIERRRGRQMLVEYQPDLDHSHDGPPVTVLYHELAHIYDFAHDTVADGTHTGADNPGADNAERVAVGLPIDHDEDPSTPRQHDARHPYDLTENALREEMGVPRAPRY